MIGNIRWNLMISSVGTVITILISLKGNLFLTSLIRGIYCFVSLFIISFLIRWFLFNIIKQPINTNTVEANHIDEEFKGHHVDVSTPTEEEESFKNSFSGDATTNEVGHSFSPLSPPRFVSKEQVDPEEVVKVIRHMSED